VPPLPPYEEKPLPRSSSKQPELPPEQLSLFREVLQLMNERDVPYVVSGAFALQAHTGIFRDTKDLDLFLPQRHLPRALQVLQEDGFEYEICDPVWLAKARRDGFFVDFITGMSNAVVVVDDSWVENARPEKVLGVPSRVLAAEELIASKVFVSRRERFDGADICHVIYGTRGRLDWPRLLARFGDEHFAMLLWSLVLFQYVYPAASHYVPAEIWNDLLGRFARDIRQPSTNIFRGSLVDPPMFHIDVDEWGLENVLDEHRKRRLDEQSAMHEAATESPAA
jgi:hypothetical protein